MNFNIETFINSLSNNITILELGDKNLTILPNLSRFTKLEELYCNNNKLTELQNLPESLKLLDCSNNQIYYIDKLPKLLLSFSCNNNKLTKLPNLPESLLYLSCNDNNLYNLPILEQNFDEYKIFNVPKTLLYLNYSGNPIYNIIDSNNIHFTNLIVKTLKNVCHLYYCLKYKKQFRNWLWKKVREPNYIDKYHPKYLIENLKDDSDLDNVLNEWI
jgi:hypothetical protein